MTTVAKGRCASEPIPVVSAMGMNPNDASNAVVNTGLSLVNASRVDPTANSNNPVIISRLISMTIDNRFEADCNF